MTLTRSSTWKFRSRAARLRNSKKLDVKFRLVIRSVSRSSSRRGDRTCFADPHRAAIHLDNKTETKRFSSLLFDFVINTTWSDGKNLHMLFQAASFVFLSSRYALASARNPPAEETRYPSLCAIELTFPSRCCQSSKVQIDTSIARLIPLGTKVKRKKKKPNTTEKINWSSDD